jgi:hypothetical protein
MISWYSDETVVGVQWLVEQTMHTEGLNYPSRYGTACLSKFGLCGVFLTRTYMLCILIRYRNEICVRKHLS